VEEGLRELVEACARDRRLFEAVVRLLMCTVELEDRLARRSRVAGYVRLDRTLAPPPEGADEEGRPLLLAFELVGGGLLYVADRGCGAIARARGRGDEGIEAEVYLPPYRLPSSMSIAIRRTEPGWVVVEGGVPPEVAIPVGEEHLEHLLHLLELRGARPAP